MGPEVYQKRRIPTLAMRAEATELQAHREEASEFFRIFPDNHVGNRPYNVPFGQDDWTCSVADFTGTFKGSMTGSPMER